VSEGWGLVWAVCRFFVQRATVTLQNNEHDDTEHHPGYEKLDRDKQTVENRLLLLQIVVGGFGHSIRTVCLVFCLMGIVQ
jgi:hypothetical protein